MKIEKRYEQLLDEILEEQKKVEKINKKIKKHEIIQRLKMKEIEPKMADETKALEELIRKLRKLNKKLMKKKGLGGN